MFLRHMFVWFSARDYAKMSDNPLLSSHLPVPRGWPLDEGLTLSETFNIHVFCQHFQYFSFNCVEHFRKCDWNNPLIKKNKRKEIKVKELQIHHEKLYSKAFAG